MSEKENVNENTNENVNTTENPHAKQGIKFATIADLKIRGVHYKIVSDMRAQATGENEKDRRFQARILREDSQNKNYNLVTNKDENIAVWDHFIKLYKKGVEEGKISPNGVNNGNMPVNNNGDTATIRVKDGDGKIVTEKKVGVPKQASEEKTEE